jgi:hypothetical protein
VVCTWGAASSSPAPAAHETLATDDDVRGQIYLNKHFFLHYISDEDDE